MDESLVTDKEVASRERLGADVAYERLFFGVCSAGGGGQLVLRRCASEEMHSLPDVPLQVLEPGEQALAVRARQRLCLGG
jgi:hypothetical protein